jgi:hypothetical protein
LDASKRFEEQQAEHAKEVILVQRAEQEEAEGKTEPGLVMRHGHKYKLLRNIAPWLLRNVSSSKPGRKANGRMVVDDDLARRLFRTCPP